MNNFGKTTVTGSCSLQPVTAKLTYNMLKAESGSFICVDATRFAHKLFRRDCLFSHLREVRDSEFAMYDNFYHNCYAKTKFTASLFVCRLFRSSF